MRIFNPDGGEVEACGNASRAVGLLLAAEHAGETRIETLGGTIVARAKGPAISVAMGVPRFGWEAIPLAYAMDTLAMPVAWEDLANPVAVNVGNPHVVFFVPDTHAVDLARLGPLIETDPLFPQRINVNVATLTRPDAIDLPGRSLGVLVVDNDATIIEASTALFAGLGHRVLGARTMADALAHLEGIDAALVDFDLDQGENGLALIDRIRGRAPHVALAMISAAQDGSLLKALRKRGT
eukprot:gene30692-39541_t